MNEPDVLISLPRLDVQHVNAISGPFTWGFPAPNAFLGFAHALERRLGGRDVVAVRGVGIICHRFKAQIHRPSGRYHQVFGLTRNPVTKEGGAAPFVEEGRAHINVTLLLAAETDQDAEELTPSLEEIVPTMRIAGGSIVPRMQIKPNSAARNTTGLGIQVAEWPELQTAQDRVFRRLRRQLLPGFALVHRPDRLQEHMTERQSNGEPATALEALLGLCAVHYAPDETDPERVKHSGWTIRRVSPGWLVPLPIGYAGLSELHPPGTVINARDPHEPFRFVESLYSLGEWISPLRVPVLEALLWHFKTDSENGLYRSSNNYADYLATSPLIDEQGES